MSKADVIRAKKRERHLAWVLCTHTCLKARLDGGGTDRYISVFFPDDPDRYHLVTLSNTWVSFHDRHIRRMLDPEHQAQHITRPRKSVRWSIPVLFEGTAPERNGPYPDPPEDEMMPAPEADLGKDHRA